jgi:hypothetical protein
MFRKTLAALACAAVISTPALASTGSVPKTDWSYSALQDLSARGMIQGYPKNADLFGARELNRYEMAALVSRVVARLVDDQQTGATPDPQTIEEVSKLLKEYSSELAVLGTNVADLKLGLQSVSDTVIEHQKSIETLDKTKVTSGFGKIALDGDAQFWFLAGNRDVTNFGGGSGTGLATTTSSGVTNSDSTLASTFKIRRIELKFSGNIDPVSYWTIMFDPSKTQTTASTSPLQDAFIGWHVNKTTNVEVGQQKVPLSIESARASTALLTIERSLMNEVSYTQGRVGDIRDLAIWGRYNAPGVATATLAILDDSGNRQNVVDDNNDKDIMANVQLLTVKNLQIGGYGDYSVGVGVPQGSRKRVGFDFDWVHGPQELTGEIEGGYDGGATTNKNAATVSNIYRLDTEGGYLTYAYKITPIWQAVTRYDVFNPNRDMHNEERDVTLGVNYYLNNQNSKIQLNYISRNITGPLSGAGDTATAKAYSSLGQSRYVYMVGFSQAW